MIKQEIFRLFLMLFFCFLSFLGFGQFVHESNIIIPLSSLENNYGVATGEEDGIVLFHEVLNDQNFNKRKWEVTVLDNSLNVKWVSVFESGMNFSISDIKYHSGYFYLWFKDVNIPAKSVLFVRFPLNESRFEYFQINEFLPEQVIGFEILGNSLFIIGNESQRPAILRFTFGDPRPFVLQGIFNEKNDILHTSVHPDLGHVQIISRMRKRGKTGMILIKHFDEKGNIIRDYLLESTKGYHMIDALATTDSTGNTIVVGTYGYKRANYSNGIYTTKFKVGEQNDLYYYDYINLYNYHNFLGSDREILNAQKRQGEGDLKINCLPRHLAALGGETLFIGEVYQKSSYGALYPKYSHALVLGVSDQGKLVWDNSISLNNGVSHSTSQKTLVNLYNGNEIIFYSDGFSMKFKIINGKNDIADIDEFMIGEFDENYSLEGFGTEQFASVLPWYENTFLIFGTKTWGTTEFSQKRFFYMDKLSIDDRPNQ